MSERTVGELEAEIERLQRENRRLDESESQLIRERDFATFWADKLASAIGDVEEIGEHSNLNSPWEQAYAIVSPAENVRRIEASLAHGTARIARLEAALAEILKCDYGNGLSLCHDIARAALADRPDQRGGGE